MNFRDSPRRSFAPVKVGDEMDVKIEAVGEKGDGIAKKDGFVLFVPNTKVNDEVKIRITRVLRKVGFAEVVGGESSQSSEKSESTEEPSQEESPSEEETEDTGNSDSEEDSEDFGEDNNQ